MLFRAGLTTRDVDTCLTALQKMSLNSLERRNPNAKVIAWHPRHEGPLVKCRNGDWIAIDRRGRQIQVGIEG